MVSDQGAPWSSFQQMVERGEVEDRPHLPLSCPSPTVYTEEWRPHWPPNSLLRPWLDYSGLLVFSTKDDLVAGV